MGIYNLPHRLLEKTYGITFTGSRNFIKKLKYDLPDIDDDLEVEVKNRNKIIGK